MLLLTHASCSSNTNREKELLYKEVMEIHDAVMPKLSDINRIKRNLKDQMESNPSIDDKLKSNVGVIINELNTADDSMMNWMNAFKVPNDLADEQVILYLKEEKLKISRVSEQMESSLANGSKMLTLLKKDKKEN